MANKKEPVPGTRGARLEEIQQASGLSRESFAARMNDRAKQLEITMARWTESLFSKAANENGKAISLDEAYVILSLVPSARRREFTWDWFVLGRRDDIARRVDDVLSSPTLHEEVVREERPTSQSRSRGRKGRGGSAR